MTGLSFKGKEFVSNHHLAVLFLPLVPDEDQSVDAQPVINGTGC